MSRIGEASIQIPKEVTVTIDGSSVVVKGPKGELNETVPKGIAVSVKNAEVVVSRKFHDTKTRALHGLVRAKIANDIRGVTTGWSKALQLSGVGYRANLSGSNLILTIGFSHPIEIVPPPEITFSVVEGHILVAGIDKYLVGQVAANIRSKKKPEPYKGKGITYSGEKVRTKAGKAAKAVGGVGVGGAAGK